MTRGTVMTIVGTRPEAIKMAPVIRELARRTAEVEQVVVASAQHRELLDQALALFRIVPDIDLGLMQPGQTLAGFASRALLTLSDLFAERRPDAVLVQGDTTTVMMAGLAAFYNNVRVGHVEAGLRSFDPRNPFPEEVNRRVTGCLADLHFAPTEQARRNLLREGVAPDRILVTGNTIVDALESVDLTGPFDDPALAGQLPARQRMLLVTTHRRENHGPRLATICAALRQIVLADSDVSVVCPVHPNPQVAATMHGELREVPGIALVSPLSYADLLRLMQRCHLVLTDSGGIQEEAPSFSKPVLILRETTERPEVVECGAGMLVGTDTADIVREVKRLLQDQAAYDRMRHGRNPFGNGRAAARIADAVIERFCGTAPGAAE